MSPALKAVLSQAVIQGALTVAAQTPNPLQYLLTLLAGAGVDVNQLLANAKAMATPPPGALNFTAPPPLRSGAPAAASATAVLAAIVAALATALAA